MNFRYATVVDAPLLAAMNQRLIEDEGHRNPMNLAQLQERMRGWLSGEYQAVIFEDEQESAGYALYKIVPPGKPDIDGVYLRQFFVARRRRRQGVGRAAIAWLRANAWRDIGRIRVDVLCNNPAGIAFWRAIGFTDYCITMECSLG